VTVDAPVDTPDARGSATLAPAASSTASTRSDEAPGKDAQQTDEAAATGPSLVEQKLLGVAADATREEVDEKMRQTIGKIAGIPDGLQVVASNGHAAAREERLEKGQPTVIFDTADSPACSDCGSIMVRNGSCYKCLNCGSTSGCS
jgi:hypothetical protein